MKVTKIKPKKPVASPLFTKVRSLIVMASFVAVIFVGQAKGNSDADAAPPFAKYAEVDQGVFRGALPGQEGVEYLKSQGIKTILNLNDSWSEKSQEDRDARSAGMSWIDESMNAFVGPTQRQMERILSSLTNPALLPIFFHCHHGKDRTGLVAALYRVHIQNWDQRRAYDEMLEFGFDRRLLLLERFFWRHSRNLGQLFALDFSGFSFGTQGLESTEYSEDSYLPAESRKIEGGLVQ